MTVDDIGERTANLSWAIVFDGHTPIREAIVYYFIEGQGEQRNTTIQGSTPTEVPLGNLMPFMTYNITVFLRNDVGTSDPASIETRTMSLGKVSLSLSLVAR